MIEAEAVVREVRGGLAFVETARRPACGSCDANTACGTAAIGKYLGRRSARFALDNRIDAQQGDRVVLGINEAALLKASFLLYALPLLGMIAGAVVAARVAGGEAPAITGGVLGLVIGFWLARRLSRQTSLGATAQVVLLRKSGLNEVAPPALI